MNSEKEKATSNGNSEQLIKTIPTCDLVNELKTREAVSYAVVDPYENFKVEVAGKTVMHDAPDSGPVILFVIWD